MTSSPFAQVARAVLFSLFKILEIVLSRFGFIYPCLLPVSAYKSSDAEDKKTKPRVLKWQEFKLKLYSLVYCVFNWDVRRVKEMDVCGSAMDGVHVSRH